MCCRDAEAQQTFHRLIDGAKKDIDNALPQVEIKDVVVGSGDVCRRGRYPLNSCIEAN